MEGRGASDLRSARFKVRVTYALAAVGTPEAPRTLVKIVSAAELQGALAEVARTGGPVVAGAVLDEFAERLRRDLEDPGSVPGRLPHSWSAAGTGFGMASRPWRSAPNATMPGKTFGLPVMPT